jgi:hypothetical protein
MHPVCDECADTCQRTVAYCLRKGGRHAKAAHILLLLDCATMCQTCANMMRRNSDFSGRICEVRAEVCERCAQSCSQFSRDSVSFG